MPTPLPIDASLAAVRRALDARGCVVLTAPTGSGKTTRVAPALLDRGKGRVLMAQPRRVAARAAARRIAMERGSAVGEEVGFEVRFERSLSKATRLVVMTDGLLLRRVLRDPLLEGVDAIVLDEFHERRLDTDLILGLLREIRREVRPDLELVVMSATLDAESVSNFLDEAPIVGAEGRTHPVDVQWQTRPDDRRIEDRVATAAREALSRSSGSVLCFLPGIGEIKRTAERLAGLEGVPVLPLHGELSAKDQDAALDRTKGRRIILATNVAESSLTLPGVDVVVDSGLCRRLESDPATGLERLELGRISRASADQRSGRAGRERPGHAVRLWSRRDEQAMEPFEAPDVARVDLARCALELLEWGVDDVAAFGWYEVPPQAALERAAELLVVLGAATRKDGRLTVTPMGRRMLKLPLHPRLARLVLAAADRERGDDGADLAALAQARDPRRGDHDGAPTASADLLVQLDLLREARRRRFDRRACSALGVDTRAMREIDRVAASIRRELPRDASRAAGGDEADLLRSLLAAFPDRVARRREARSERAVMVGGRGLRLDARSVVRDAELFVALDLDTARRRGADALVRSASAVREEWLEHEAPQLLSVESGAELDARGRVAAVERRLFADLVLDERRGGKVDPVAAAAVLAEAVRGDPERFLGRRDDVAALAPRWRLLTEHAPELRLPPLDQELLVEALVDACAGCRSVEDVARADLRAMLEGRLDRRQRAALSTETPSGITLPNGRRARLRYGEREVPVVSSRVQDFFGLRRTPTVCFGRVRCVVELLAPNNRPVQVTTDLENFWNETYAQVRKDLRGRYPKHSWPEDPP